MNPLRIASLSVAVVVFSYAVMAQSSSQSVPDAPSPTQQPTTQAAPAASSPGQQSAPASERAFGGQEAPNAPAPQAAPGPQPTGPTVIFDTTMGQMICKLFDKQAPTAVANFVGLATGTKDWVDPATKQTEHGKPYYDGTTFHRVIPEFMIQGGDRLGTGEGDPGYSFKDEFDPDLNFDVAGRLAMANSGPNTNGSQFFITEAPYPSLDQHYVIFGQCDEHSVLVVQSIARVNRDGNDKPLEPVTLNKVTVVPAGQAAASGPTAKPNNP